MTYKFYSKNTLINILFLLLLLLSTSNLFAQISHSFQLNYGGAELKGNVEIAIKIIDKARDSKQKAILFSDKKIKADVSKFKKPTLVLEFSNLKFKAPRDLVKNLALSIPTPSPPKGFVPYLVADKDPLKVGEKISFNFEIAPADTILANNLTFKFAYITIGKRNFKIKNNTLKLDLNINPPPLFPPNATENELWKIANRLKTVKAYNVYIERYPRGKSIQKAKQNRKYLIDNPVSKINDTGLSTNIPTFQKDENKEWIRAKKVNKIEAYNAYLKDFPKGKHAQKAKTIALSLSDSLDGKIMKSAEEEIMGRLIYHIDDTMTIGQIYRVRMEISSDTTSHFIEKLIANVEEYSDHPEDFNNEIIQIGKTMRAHLEESSPEGEENFYIHLFGESDEREVDLYSSNPTIWEWDVTPLKEGYHPLYFTVEIITIKDGVEIPKVLPVYDSKIIILSRSIFEAYKMEFIAGGIICALLVVIIALFFRKKKSASEQKNLDKLLKSNPLEGATTLIENDKVREALNVLDQFLNKKDSELVQEIILLKSRISSNEKNLNKATISKETAANERNNIKLAILDIIERSKIIS